MCWVDHWTSRPLPYWRRTCQLYRNYKLETRRETLLVTRSRALVQYVFISPYLCLGKPPILHFRPCGLGEVFLTLSFKGEFCVGLSQSSFHIALTRVIDLGIYLQLNLGNEQTQNICLSVNREKFHFLDLKLKKLMNPEAIIAI